MWQQGPHSSASFDVLHAVLAMACHIGLVKHEQSHAADGIFFEELLALVKHIDKATSTIEGPSKPGDGHTIVDVRGSKHVYSSWGLVWQLV